MAPSFTIGIPTYNRADFLSRSMACALAQTLPDVEIIVSDNGSTDRTSEVVRRAGDRVRYLRSDINLGALANFARALEGAQGEYFSFLQDDDLIHRDFARRARTAMSSPDNVVVYAAYAAESWSSTSFHYPALAGPPFALDWTSGAVRLVAGYLVIPFCLFFS